MGSSHHKKRMNVKDDRLSSLSDDLIHKILSFIDLKYVIQTSALSSRWRYRWTSMPYLIFSREFYTVYSKFSEFVTNVLSNHDIQKGVHSVKFNFNGGRERDHDSVKQILTSTLELPALTTLCLHDVSLHCIGIFSNCANLKNFTLKRSKMFGAEGSSICLPQLSSLTLDEICGIVKGFNIVAPQLKNLTIRFFFLQDLQCLRIFAPDLVFFLYRGNKCLPFSTDDFLSLENADICVNRPTDAHQVLRLLQQLHNVKYLTLNLEIVELLSSSVELMSCQSSPFANLKSLNFHQVSDGNKRVKMSAQVKSYLLDSSPCAAFAMVSCEIEKAIIELRALLEHEKATIETKMTKTRELWKAQVDIDSCLKYMSVQIEEGKEKVTEINLKLEEIRELMGELHASNTTSIQPSFSTLYAEAETVTKIIKDCIKMNCDESQRRLNECFHELATTLQPSS